MEEGAESLARMVTAAELTGYPAAPETMRVSSPSWSLSLVTVRLNVASPLAARAAMLRSKSSTAVKSPGPGRAAAAARHRYGNGYAFQQVLCVEDAEPVHMGLYGHSGGSAVLAHPGRFDAQVDGTAAVRDPFVVHVFQGRHGTERGGQGAGQVVLAELEGAQRSLTLGRRRQRAELGGDGSGEVVVREVEVGEVGEAAELGGDGSGEVVVREVEVGEVGEAAELGWGWFR